MLHLPMLEMQIYAHSNGGGGDDNDDNDDIDVLAIRDFDDDDDRPVDERIKERDRRIAELRDEVDELRDLVQRLREHAEDYDNVIEQWKEAFQMTETDGGGWTWEPFWQEHWATINDYNAIVRDWNKYLHLINGRTQPVGRPLAASEAQVARVLKLHKAGKSLRGIVDETSLGLNTVRTIVGKANGTDRTTKHHRARIEIDRAQIASQKRQRRTGAALPRQAQRVVEEGQALIKEAKGLGRG
jgi:hypothetical protein